MHFIPKKSLGQHFLNNPRIPKLMADSGGVREGDTVLEIGPGTGMLTRELLARRARVIAIETDKRAIHLLQDTFETEISTRDLTIFDRDARTLTLSELNLTEHTYKVVSNIPYYLSGKLLRILLEDDIQPLLIVFLLQKEVAARIACDTKESLLSLAVKVYGRPHYVQTVSRGNFTPSPQVDSAIISISDISHERLQGIDEAFFFELLHAGFAAKRKQLVGNVSKKVSREALVHIFSSLSLPLSVRAEDLTIEEWLKLVRTIQMHTK